MHWKVVRLELASNWEFPRGSAGRSYLIRLPLNDEGAIDTAMLERQPTHATVRRYWPNQADMIGYLVHTPEGYAIRYDMNGSTVNPRPHADGHLEQDHLFRFSADPVTIGEEILLVEPDGHEARFRIAGLQ